MCNVCAIVKKMFIDLHIQFTVYTISLLLLIHQMSLHWIKNITLEHYVKTIFIVIDINYYVESIISYSTTGTLLYTQCNTSNI